MGFLIEKLPDEPILIYMSDENYQITTDLDSAIAAVRQVLDAQSEPVYFINNGTKSPPLSMEELLMASNRLTLGADALYHHPKIKRLLVVTTDPFVHAAYDGARSQTFGNLVSLLFPTTDEALVYARSHKE